MGARPVRAQQKTMPVVGFLGIPSSSGFGSRLGAFRQGLNESGYVEGQTVMIEYRWAEGRYDRLPHLAADLVDREVNVIVAGASAAALAARSATPMIPIVFVAVADPVAIGLVASLARPGGNVTGISVMSVELMPKRLEMISELAPQAGVIALMVNPSNPNAERMIEEVQKAAQMKSRQLHVVKARIDSEIDAAFATLAGWQVGGARPRPRSIFPRSTRATCDIGDTPSSSGDLRVSRIRNGGRPGKLWTQHNRCLSPCRGVCGPHSRRYETGRSAGPAADHIRACHQCQDCQGARPNGPAIDPRSRRRGHRIANHIHGERPFLFRPNRPNEFGAMAGVGYGPASETLHERGRLAVQKSHTSARLSRSRSPIYLGLCLVSGRPVLLIRPSNQSGYW